MILGFSSKRMVVVRFKQNIRPPSLAVGFLDGTGGRPAVVAAPSGFWGLPLPPGQAAAFSFQIGCSFL